MVFQDPTGALNPRQTIYEAVAEGLRIQDVAGDEERLGRRGARRAPACARRSGSSRRYPHEVSGGQRQRVRDRRGDGARARRCSSPTSRCRSLDASVRGEILALMLALVRRDRA